MVSRTSRDLHVCIELDTNRPDRTVRRGPNQSIIIQAEPVHEKGAIESPGYPTTYLPLDDSLPS